MLNRKNLARQKPQPKTRNISRKGAKHVLSNVEGAAKKFKLSDLAFLASWREQIPVLDSHWPAENLLCALCGKRFFWLRADLTTNLYVERSDQRSFLVGHRNFFLHRGVDPSEARYSSSARSRILSLLGRGGARTALARPAPQLT